MSWFERGGNTAADGSAEGEELQGLLMEDEVGSDGRNPSDANPLQADILQEPQHARLCVSEIGSRAARARAEAQAAERRAVLEHLETIDWSCSRFESRRHEAVVVQQSRMSSELRSRLR